MDTKRLKPVLDTLYAEFDFKGRILNDPIEFPSRYRHNADIEASAFIASAFAYGRVDVFKPVIGRILKIMAPSPASYLKSFDLKKERAKFKGISYRFYKEYDVVAFVYILSEVLKKHGSLQKTFMKRWVLSENNLQEALSGFVSEFYRINTKPVFEHNVITQGMRHFFPMPEKGGACKRLNLFLRWMTRDKDIDFGLWRKLPPSELIIPLDTHIARISRCLGLTGRKDAGWKTAFEITNSLKQLDSRDPLKYDFALCHIGMLGLCRPDGSACAECTLVKTS